MRFRVYKNLDGAGYLLDVQADNTRGVVPLLPLDAAPMPAKTLNPVFDIEGNAFSMATQFLAAVPAQMLKIPLLSLEDKRDDITAALNLLFQG